jgi:hypothetical protein
MTILGEVALDEDGVMQGWCWDPDRPAERLTVDILIDETIIASPVASALREDLHFRKFGDGRHGFTVTLTRQIAAARKRAIISARERSSGDRFWHQLFRPFCLPEGYDERLRAARGALESMARSPALADAARHGQLAGGLAALGSALRARAGVAPKTAALRPFALAAQAVPALSVIVDAGNDAMAVFAALRNAAGSLGMAGAEVILTDEGADKQGLRLQGQAKNLGYVFTPEPLLARRRNLGAGMARSDALVFLDHLQNRPGDALAVLAQPAGTITIPGEIADMARRIAPGMMADMVECAAPAGLGLALAAPRKFFEAQGGFDPKMDDGAGLEVLDWVLRAARQGAPMTVWRSPWPVEKQARPVLRNDDAGKFFTARWMTGANP